MYAVAPTSRARKLKDQLARAFVTAGGLSIIASVLGMLIFLLVEVAPLWSSGRYEVHPPQQIARPVDSVDHGEVIAIVVDPYQTHVAMLFRDGTLQAQRLADGAIVATARALPEGDAARVVHGNSGLEHLAASTTDGRIVASQVVFDVDFDGQQRVVKPTFVAMPDLQVDPERRPLQSFDLRSAHGSTAAAAQLADDSLVVLSRSVVETPMTGERTTTEQRIAIPCDLRYTRLAIDLEAHNLYVGAKDGRLCWWPLQDGKAGTPQVIAVSSQLMATVGSSSDSTSYADSAAQPGAGRPTAIVAMTLLLGDRSLIVAGADGSLSQWFQVRQGDSATIRLACIRVFEGLGSGVRALAASHRHKGFLALGQAGVLGAYYATTGAQRFRGQLNVADAAAVCYSPKGDAAVIAGARELVVVKIQDLHPEATVTGTFGKTWFEGAPGPEYTWESTGGTNAFESKLSLVPLIYGTLKSTIFSLLLSVPLAVLGAMYVAHFMHPDLRRWIKPTVELMASLPSVVLGFVAAMWLAPRVESGFMALVLAPLILPLCILVVGALGMRLPPGVRGRFPLGAESLGFVVVLALGFWVCTLLAPLVERFVFGGDLIAYLAQQHGVRYEQQNAIVVGLAMSFAVIPIIFSIAEEAFSNVPRSLISGSLALGASRWQTVTRVVLPTASPGIFSAVMVGFGRAVGETMIVVMAAGSTPILDPSPFNGFRTLSANIANEISEAPQGGTLYRVLFLAALVLFAFTFCANTVAELIRQRLRMRYAGL